MAKQDFKYEGVGYNGPHLAAMPFDLFKKQVEHHFQTGEAREERIKDLYDKIQKKYPQAQKVGAGKWTPPATDAEAAKPLDEREEKAVDVKPVTSPGQVAGGVASLNPDPGAVQGEKK
jgi:hypothetical protein